MTMLKSDGVFVHFLFSRVRAILITR